MELKQRWKDINMAVFESKVEDFKTTSEFSDSLWGQHISVVGVGGIGSIIAEHLVHMGFSHINLIDFDTLEL